ncbi:MAG: PhoH family protein [Candidatus Marinimicrobia bacterium]|nr:PhoH family protein [Candidatus Neomarinimicrobiota bacterium]
MKKLFVLDTNVILHDSGCIYQFEDNDVVIPIVVLEELDRFKKGNDTVNFQAREFVRELDHLAGDSLFNGGIKLTKEGGTLRVLAGSYRAPEVQEAFREDTPDHRILSAALALSKEEKKRKVVLVTKDVNLRMKAKSLGVEAQDYSTDKIKNIEELYIGKSVVDPAPPEIIDRLYEEPYRVDFQETKIEEEPYPWHHFILKNGQKSALAVYNPNENNLIRTEKRVNYGISPRNAEQLFGLDLLNNPEILLATLTGKAGTGKTLLALAAAMEQRQNFRQIYLARPVVPLSNKDIGYLPGDIKSKLDPYLQPLWDNLKVIQNQYLNDKGEFEKINQMVEDEKLVIAPLTYIRGRSLQKIFFIVDEAQNLTPHEVKTIITRAGEGTKIVFTGDIYQIDHPFLDSQSNGLSYLIDRFKGQRVYGHINLEKGERSALAELASNLL